MVSGYSGTNASFLVCTILEAQKATRVWRHSVDQKLSPEKSVFKPILKLVVVLLALTCLIIGLVNPKMGTKIETVKREGIDIVFAVDVSKVCWPKMWRQADWKKQAIGFANYQQFGQRPNRNHRLLG